MKLNEFKCPKCGSTLKVESISTLFCMYCGAKLYIDDDASKLDRTLQVVTSAMNKANEEVKEARLEKERIELEKIKENNKEKISEKKYFIISIFLLLFLPSIIMWRMGEDETKNKREDNIVETPFASEDLKNENYEKVIKQLEDAGFTNIETHKMEDLVFGLLTSDGEVEAVTIKGVENFYEGQNFEKAVKVVVYYHTFPEDETD